MAETISEFSRRIEKLLLNEGCAEVRFSWSSSPVRPEESICLLRFKDKEGREKSVAFDWPPARGAVDSLMSQVVGYPVMVDGYAVFAAPAGPTVPGAPKQGYPTIGGFVAQCEYCDGLSDRADNNKTRGEPWRFGLCVECRKAKLIADGKRRQEEVAAPPKDNALAAARQVIAQQSDELVDLKIKLADLRLRAIANSKVAGVILPAEPSAKADPWRPSIDDFDLLPDA
jgi:hypothetical protein